MRSCSKLFLTASIVLFSVGLWAQEVDHASSPDILVRFSYESSPGTQGEGLQHICFAVSVAGKYRMIRSTDSGQTLRMQGKMPVQQFQQFQKTLLSSEFRGLSGNHEGLIRGGAENFVAEFPKPDGQKSQWLQWLNADGDNPFPASVAKVIHWLKDFQPKDGREFNYAEYQDVCPSMGLSYVQPLAANRQP